MYSVEEYVYSMGKSKKTNHNKSNKMRKTMKQRQGGMHRALQLGPRLTVHQDPYFRQ
jgi:hypothetical protein